MSRVQSLGRKEQEVVETKVAQSYQVCAGVGLRAGLGAACHWLLLLLDQFFDSRERLGDVLD
jgi:hypothetical protein